MLKFTSEENLLYITKVEDVKEYEITEKGAYRVKVKYLLHKGIGASNLQLRLFTIDVGGYTPLEKHAHEHEVFILKGSALLKSGNQETHVTEGNIIFIPSMEEHQFRNISEKPVKFLCTKET